MESVVTTLSGLMGSCAADFFSSTPTHAAEPSSARIAKLRQEFNSLTPLMPTVGTSTVPEKLADLQHPDAEHLTLGINLKGLREACELVGFPYEYGKDAWGPYDYTYKRDDHPEMAWLGEAYPSSNHYKFLGYDFCCAIKAWLKANGHEHESICQVLQKRGSKNVRRANVFYSHIQGVDIWETIRLMRDGIAAHKAQLPSTDESQLFFWLGAPPPSPIDYPPLARTSDTSRVCRGRLHHAQTMRVGLRPPTRASGCQGDRPHAGGARP